MRSTSRVRHPRIVAAAACLLVLGLLSVPVAASDAKLMEDSITVDAAKGFSVKQLFQSEKNPSHYYYLPTKLRIRKSSDGEHQITIYRYNMAYSDGKWAELNTLKGQQNEVYQGGVLRAVFTFALEEGELKRLTQEVRAQRNDPNITISRLPLNSAETYIYIIDPEAKEQPAAAAPKKAPEAKVGSDEDDDTDDPATPEDEAGQYRAASVLEPCEMFPVRVVLEVLHHLLIEEQVEEQAKGHGRAADAPLPHIAGAS